MGARISTSRPEKNLYLIACPGTIRPNSDFTVVASVHESEVPAKIKVSIAGPAFYVEKIVEVEPFSFTTISFPIPFIRNGSYNVTAVGLAGIHFKKNVNLEYSNFDSFSLVQTDKATYKPGDLIRFRILILDKQTCPAKIESPVSISITDAQQNVIKQVHNAEFINGVYSGELQLLQFPNLGQWEIMVKYGSESDEFKFDVDKYVLPKFEVTIDVPKHVLKSDGKVKAVVRAKYTFDKPVKGEAVITVTRLHPYWGDQSNLVLLTKTAPLEGSASLEIDFANELGEQAGHKFKITAAVEETLTGIKQHAIAEVIVHTERFKIEAVNIPNNFWEDVPLKITVVVKNFDETPRIDTANPIVITMVPDQCRWPRLREGEEEVNMKRDKKDFTFEKQLDANGMVTVIFTPRKDVAYGYSIQVNYLEIEENLGYIPRKESRSGSFFELDAQIENATLNNEVSMKVSSNLPLKYFFYQIVARGDIIEAGKIDVPDNQSCHVFKFQTTFAIIPSCYVFAYYINEGEVVFAERKVEIEQQLNNFIQINSPTQAKVGDEIELNIKTKPDSYVGLLGVDQSVLLLKSGNDLSKDDVFRALRKFKTKVHMSQWDRKRELPGWVSGPAVMTNAGYPIIQNGEMTIANKVPDTITSWILTGFSINAESGLGLTNQSHKLQVFQPFFVSTNLPVKRGEVIAIPVIVFNYMDDNINADLTLDNAHGEFEFVSPPGETNSTNGMELQQTKAIEIVSGAGVSKSFLIRPKKAGEITLKIAAISPVAGDILTQILRVDPEGVTQFVNKAVFLDLKDQQEKTKEISIEVPKDAVSDSTYIEFSVVGDLLGPTIKNLDELVRKPYGCGEQNMVNFVPNILVLKYLTGINKLTSAIESKAKKFLEIGYQRELTYKHSDGSYSAFGKCDKCGSTWLTAYVARSFCEAANGFTNIDENVIEQALKFLAKTQSENGSFPETGRIIDHHHVDKSGKDLSLTAFTLLAFLEHKAHEKPLNKKRGFFPWGAVVDYHRTINKGLDYLVKNIDDETDIYSLAISAYALQMAKHEKRDIILEKLNARQKKKGGHSWWADNEPEKEENQCEYYWYEPQTSNIEITAYGLLAQLESGAGGETLPTLKWLVTQRNNGGFSSTQDTVVGLQALIKFSEKYNVERGDIEISFSDDKGNNGVITVNDKNAMVLQTHVVDPEAKLVKFTGKGKGSTLFQISYKYNVDKKDDSPRFTIKPQVTETSKVGKLQLSVGTSFIPLGDEETSNMAVMEVSLPSGYISDEDNLNEIEKMERVKKVETKDGESVIVIYFDYLDSIEVCPIIKGFRAHRVAKQKPSAIIVYDYYDNSRQAREFYKINNTSLNEICEGA